MSPRRRKGTPGPKPNPDRREVHEHVLTLRLSTNELDMLHGLIEAKRAELQKDHGGASVRVTPSSLIRELLTKEAAAYTIAAMKEQHAEREARPRDERKERKG